MASFGLSRFLTTWFTLDAILNGSCGVAYLFFPAAFFAGIGGPYGDDVTPNLVWTVRTQASYFAMLSACLLVAARSRDPVLRRRLCIAFVSGAVWQVPAAIIRRNEVGGSNWVLAVSLVVIAVVCAPYLWFIIVRNEERAEMAWMPGREPDEQGTTGD